jgi:hypothetical protein
MKIIKTFTCSRIFGDYDDVESMENGWFVRQEGKIKLLDGDGNVKKE